jgi:putative ABC transport system permease protein
VRSIVSRGFALTLTGLVIGSVLAAVTAELLTPLLYGARPDYLPAVAATSVILIAVAALACLVPARRASHIDPVIALRNE